MEISKHTRNLIDRAATQIVRQLSRTAVGDLRPLIYPNGSLKMSVEVTLGPEMGLKYIRVALGTTERGALYSVPLLIEAVSSGRDGEAHRIVEEVIAMDLSRRGAIKC